MPNQLALVAASLFILFVPPSARAQSPSKLKSLVNDTAAQFQMAYRQNTAEHRLRYDQLSRALAEWKKAPRSEENDRLLADWLRGAIRRSMPGSREPLPPLPEFQRPSNGMTSTHVPTAEKQTGNPFADDPIGSEESIQ